MSDPAPQRDAILTALEHLLAWPEIARSPQLAKFLDYIVRRTLDGDEQSIKAYSIAVDVLGRAADFDPQADPIVRVQARRLRGLLDDYYRGPGSGEVTRISLPVGRYVPEFTAAAVARALELAVADADPASDAGQRARAFAAADSPFPGSRWSSSRAGIAVVAYRPQYLGAARAERGQSPGARCSGPASPSSNSRTWPVRPAARPMVAGLAIELVTDLEQFEDIDVRYGGGGEADIAVADLATSDYVLTGIVRPDGLVVQYSAILTDSTTGGGGVEPHHSGPGAKMPSMPDVLDRVSRVARVWCWAARVGRCMWRLGRCWPAMPRCEGGVNLYLCRHAVLPLSRDRQGGRAPSGPRPASRRCPKPTGNRRSAWPWRPA